MAQTYAHDMRAAAYRHLQAAERLRSTDRKDVAGYLFGIAAECALKQMMLASGMRPRREEERRNDPFYAHFESLKSMLRDSASRGLLVRIWGVAIKKARPMIGR